MKKIFIKNFVRFVTGVSLLKPVILLARTAYYSVIDFYESLFGLREDMVPPRRMAFMGYGGFKKNGLQFLEYFIKLGGLKPEDKVLDVGCGMGRMAAPLTGYLTNEGRYEGIDILAKGIAWCNKEIAPRYPNFKFHVADIYNKQYHPKGKYQASDYKFPYPDHSFDFVFLTSVFTHMVPRDMENYLSEISRVLRKNGTCFITYFLLNEQSLSLMDKENSEFNFKYGDKICRFIDKGVPERATAYDEEFVRKLYEKYGLQITKPVQYGSWCGRRDYVSYQDIILATKN